MNRYSVHGCVYEHMGMYIIITGVINTVCLCGIADCYISCLSLFLIFNLLFVNYVSDYESLSDPNLTLAHKMKSLFDIYICTLKMN